MKKVYLLGLVWGWSYFFIKKSLPGFTPLAIAFGRTALGAITLFLVVKAKRLTFPKDRQMWTHLAVLAVVSNAFPFVTQSIAQVNIPSTLASVLNATTPFFTALIGTLTMTERLKRSQVGGLVIGFTGVVIAAGVGGDEFRHTALVSVLLMLASTVSYSIGFHYARKNVRAASPIVVACGQQILASLLLVGPAVWSTVHSDRRPGGVAIASMLALGVVGTGLAWILNFTNIATVGPANASAVTFLVAIVAFFCGIVLLNERLFARHLIGGIVTLFGVALLQQRLGPVLKKVRPAPTSPTREPQQPSPPLS